MWSFFRQGSGGIVPYGHSFFGDFYSESCRLIRETIIPLILFRKWQFNQKNFRHATARGRNPKNDRECNTHTVKSWDKLPNWLAQLLQQHLSKWNLCVLYLYIYNIYIHNIPQVYPHGIFLASHQSKGTLQYQSQVTKTPAWGFSAKQNSMEMALKRSWPESKYNTEVVKDDVT